MTTWAVPSQVWVAVVVVTSEVQVRDVPAAGALPGRVTLSSLFAPTRIEARSLARVVACCASEEACREVLATWLDEHPGTAGDVSVQAVAFGKPKKAKEEKGPSACIGCGAEISHGFRCDRCAKAFHAECAQADTGAEEELVT
jgi:hypothetical protein